MLEEMHHLWFTDTESHDDPQVRAESKSDPAGILQQGQTQLRRPCVNHPCVVAGIQAGQEGRGAQCQTSWHPHRDTIGRDCRELSPAGQRVVWTGCGLQPAVFIRAGRHTFIFLSWLSKITLTQWFYIRASDKQSQTTDMFSLLLYSNATVKKKKSLTKINTDLKWLCNFCWTIVCMTGGYRIVLILKSLATKWGWCNNIPVY